MRALSKLHVCIFFRIRNSSYRLSRPPNHIGRYKMIRHEKRERAVNR
jgi:hypothetical protein